MTIMMHELTVYDDGRVDGCEDIHIRGGDYYSHTLRFTFLNGIPGTKIRMKLQPKGKAAVFYDAEDETNNAASFTPPVWEAGDVWIQLEVKDEQTDAVWNSARLLITVQESIYGASIAPKLMDTSGAMAAPENLQTGKTAYANGKKITGTVPTLEGSTVIMNTVSKRVVEGPCLVLGDIDVSVKNVEPWNIRKGVSIAGVKGTYSSYSEIERYEKQTVVVSPNEYINIDGNGIEGDDRNQFDDFPDNIEEIWFAELYVHSPISVRIGGKLNTISEITNLDAIVVSNNTGQGVVDYTYWIEVNSYGLYIENSMNEIPIDVDLAIYYKAS